MKKLLKKKNEANLLPERIYADEMTGLSDKQVLNRIIDGYSNLPVAPPTKTIRQIIFSNLFTYFNLIFFVLAGCIIAVRSYNDLMFMPIVIANIFIGIIQEINSKITLDKLTLLSSPHAKVVRESREIETTIDNLVLDDIAVFGAGAQICADAVVISGEASVNEALVTGEPDEIIKKVGDELLSGSFIVSGKCYARLEKVGADSFVSKLTINAKKQKKIKKAGMMKSLTRLIQIIGILIIPIGAALFLKQLHTLELPLDSAVIKTTAALIGMIPEGLYLLVSVALAVSVIRLAKKRTLVHELGCIETLARVDILCVDKTGTITENEMNLSDIIPLTADREAVTSVLCDLVGNMDSDNNTMVSLKKYFSDKSFRPASIIIPFSSQYKYSGVSFGKNENYIIGAPEFVLKNQYRQYKDVIESYASGGNRVLVLASSTSTLTGGPLTDYVTALALVLLTNRIRPEARQTFEYFKHQGVCIKVISGDNPITVSQAASQAGIANSESYVDASTLDTHEKISRAAREFTIFGRVTPEQKKQLIAAMKHGGHTVAMTGDGVNDVLALKEADCSIAMASGSEVASQVSQLVLLDSNFSSMPEVVAEGRRVINNIERASSLFLVKNIFSFLLAWITIFAVFAYPIQPSQLSLVNMFTIGIPSFILALEPNTNLVRGKFLRNVLFRALPAGLTNLILILLTVLFSVFFELPEESVSTICALLMAVTGLFMLARVCKPWNFVHILLVSSMAVILTLSVIIIGPMFSITILSAGEYLVFAILALLSWPAMNGISNILDKINNIKTNITKKFKGDEDEDE